MNEPWSQKQMSEASRRFFCPLLVSFCQKQRPVGNRIEEDRDQEESVTL